MTAIQDISDFLAVVLNKQHTVFVMALHDIKRRYLGSFFGFIWAFAQPIVMTIILWVVMGIVFASNQIKGVPFFIWLLTGMVAWSFIVEAISTSAGVFREYAFLVKKVQFKYVILPFMKIISALIIHFVFLCILFMVLTFKKYIPTPDWFGLFYYFICAIVLLLGIGWLTSSISVIFPDMPHIINVILQFGFWLTPVFWSTDMLPNTPHVILLKYLTLINPVAYIIEGYRNTLLYNTPFWTDIYGMIAFWFVTIVTFILGIVTFSRSKTHFADLL